MLKVHTHDVPAASGSGHLQKGPGICLFNKNTSNSNVVSPCSRNAITNTEYCIFLQIKQVAIYVIGEETKVQKEQVIG